jgi:glycosyltransferase involved in cell wall biosynthesis
MRILITSDIFPPHVGGPATYVPRIAAELARRSHQVVVVTYSIVQSHAADTSYPFSLVRVMAAEPRWRRLPRTLSAILTHGRHADLIYANGLVTESVLANYALRKPIVAKVVGDLAWERSRDKGWIHDDIERFQTRRYSPKVELMRWRRNFSYARMGSIIVPSGYLKKMVLQYWGLPADRVQVVYNSFEPSASDSVPVDLPLNTKYRLITVCRLTTWKGVDGLIEAVAGMPEVGLVIVGDGPEWDGLHRLAQRLGLAGRVHFAGRVPQEQVYAYLRACDVFVLNSTYEGLPHVVLEALAAGLPVVATCVGGVPEALADGINGRLVPVGNQAALQAAVVEMLDARNRQWVDHAAGLLPDRFSAERMVADTLAVLMRAAHK